MNNGSLMHKQTGFSLMELLVALVITAILVAVALPSYQSHVRSTKRAVASSCLVELSQFMERTYTANMVYNQNNGAATVLPATSCRQTLNDSYTFNLSAEAQVYSLSAVPKGSQSSDSSCGTLTLNQAGVRAANGDSSDTKVKKCW